MSIPLRVDHPDKGVLLVGAFGQRNPGDEALLSAFCAALPGRRVVAASTDPVQTKELHGIPAINSRSWREVTRAVNDSVAVVFAGGTVFKALPNQVQRPPLALLRNALALSTYARARGRLVLQVGVGVGRLDAPGAALLVRRIAAQADLLIVRDADSARLMTKAGVPAPLRVGADAAWTLLDEAPVHVAREDRVVVVPSRWAVADAPSHLATLAAALRPLLDSGTKVQVQPWQIGGDSGLDDRDHAYRLARLLDNKAEVVAPPIDLTAASHYFAGARLVVAARFHALVAAAAAGTRTLGIANEPKQTALAARLGQRCVPSVASHDDVAAAVNAALHGSGPTAAAVRAEIAAAEEGFGLLRLMLADGRDPAESVSGLRLEPAW